MSCGSLLTAVFKCVNCGCSLIAMFKWVVGVRLLQRLGGFVDLHLLQCSGGVCLRLLQCLSGL